MIIDLGYRRLVRPLLFRAYGGDAERVHERTLAAIAQAGRSRQTRRALAVLCARHRQPVSVAGIQFPGLVGLAAGMDKDGIGIKTWGSLGFGFVELGTVTAQSQPGNDRPRLFRLPSSAAIINRMGFNNRGAQALARSTGDCRGGSRQHGGRHPDRYLDRQDQGRATGRRDRGLPRLAAPPCAVRGLCRRKHLQPEYAWTALAARCPAAGRPHPGARDRGMAARCRRSTRCRSSSRSRQT